MSVAVAPERFALDPMKLDIAVASPLVPALGCIIVGPIMPPIDMEIGVPFAFPSMMPSAASFIIAVTKE